MQQIALKRLNNLFVGVYETKEISNKVQLPSKIDIGKA